MPLVCVQCSRHTHLVCDTHVTTLREAIALGANASVPLLCAATAPFFQPQLSFFIKFTFYVPQGRAENRLLLFGGSVSNYNFSPLATE